MKYICIIIFILFLPVFSADELMPMAVLTESDSGGSFGWSVTAGDFDADGDRDIAVGAPMSDAGGENSGAIYIYSSDDLSAPTMTIIGLSPGDQLGIALDCAGDFNGDGYDDLLAGANVVDSTGAAFLFFGGPDFDNLPDVALAGEMPFDNFGYAVAGVGDLNDDGYDDVAIGALYNDFRGWRTGRVYIYFGGDAPDSIPDIVLTGIDSLDDFGTDVDGGLDFDDDGVPDILIGAVQAGGSPPLKPGAAYVFTGNRMLVGIDAPEFTFTGEFPMDFFGGTIAALGDINGDGYDDVISGAYNYREYAGDATAHLGRAYIYLGKPGTSAPWETPDMYITGRDSNDFLGGCVGAPGDVNGDGYDDIAVSAGFDTETETYPGVVLILTGSPTPDNEADYFCRGEFDGQNFGWCIEALGDINDDGFPDFAVGAPEFHNIGKVYLYAGFSSVVPIVAELVSPFDGAITSDSLQKVMFVIHTERIIDTMSIRFVVNDDTISWGDAGIALLNDTLIYEPFSPFGDGDTVSVCLDDVRTTVNDPLSERVCTYFLVDLSPPVVFFTVPDSCDVVNYRKMLCAWVVMDSVSGRFSREINTVIDDVYTPAEMSVFGKNAVVWTDVDEALLATARVPYTVCLNNLCDSVDYGLPNCAEQSCVQLTFSRRWLIQLKAFVSDRETTSLSIGQYSGASAGYDAAYDLLMLPPTPAQSDVRLGDAPVWMQRNVQNELAETLIWHIANLDSSEATIMWDAGSFPDGVFLWSGVYDMAWLNNATIASGTQDSIVAIFGNPKLFPYEIKDGWMLLGFPGHPAFNNIDNVEEVGAIGCYAFYEHSYHNLHSWLGGAGFFVFGTRKAILPVWFYSLAEQTYILDGFWHLLSPPIDRAEIHSEPTASYIPPPFKYEDGAYTPADTLRLGVGYWFLLSDSTIFSIGE